MATGEDSAAARFADIAATEESGQIFAALDRMAQDLVGARLVSCSVFDEATWQARRVYTNNPDVYPLSGLKAVTPSRWTETVLDNGQIFVANSIDEIAEVFPDHPTIAGLGLGAAMNLPVRLAGAFLGTVNLLDKPGAYGPDQLEAAKDLRLPAIAAFCSLHHGG